MDEPRWSVLMVATFAAGLLMAGAAQWAAPGAPPPGPARPDVDWLLAVALATAWRCRDASLWPAMAWCGAMADLFAGGRPGANVILFVLAGEWLNHWRRGGVRLSRPGARWLAGLALAFFVVFLRPFLQAPDFWLAYSPAELPAAALTAAWTGLLVPLVEALMQFTGWKTWRAAEPFGR